MSANYTEPVALLPFKALRHQMCLVGIHDEGELIDEVLWLNETLESADHRHFTVLEHYHGQEWVGILSQRLGNYSKPSSIVTYSLFGRFHFHPDI